MLTYLTVCKCIRKTQ